MSARHMYRYQEEIDREVGTAFKAGLLLGLGIGLAILAAVIWLWAVPTVDSALAMAQQGVMSA